MSRFTGLLKWVFRPNPDSVDTIRNTEWHAAWSGPYALLEVSTTSLGVYFFAMQEIFGECFTHYLVEYRNGVAFSKPPADEYEALGKHLAALAADPAFLARWMEDFKKSILP